MGAFTYTYPITLPSAAYSLAPNVDLSYNSGSVDGQTASTQAQSSWVGDGWSTADSYIEQSFISCSDSPEGTASPTSSNDMCYNGPILTMSLGGSSTSLVWDATKDVWKAQDDSGDVITQVGGSVFGPGSDASSMWVVTERDGTEYEFGLDKLPGYTTGAATTNSVDTEPVYSAHSGDPCYSPSGFTSSVCSEAYRWHLDYVKDVHGNAMAYYYDQATNNYDQDNGASTVSYVRDSYLVRIDYGFTDGNAYGQVADRIMYTTGDRCVSGMCDPLSSTTAANWPDVPFDLVCASGPCSSYAPSFFSTVRLTGISTEQWNGSGWAPVDSWALAQTMPVTGDGTSPTLWLSSIIRTGSDTTAGGSSVTVPAITFGNIQLGNRVNPNNGLPALYRYRIASITTETGSVIGVSYSSPDPCTATYVATAVPSSNTLSCFPMSWTPSGYTAPITDWFNQYSVSQVTQSDPTGGSGGLVTGYEYAPTAAWHYDDNEVVQAKYRTYGQFRGYAWVQTFTGASTGPQTESQTWYYQGMDGNWLNSTGTSVQSATVGDSQGGLHTDSDQLAGDVLESAVYTYAGGPVDHSTIDSYWVSPATATRTRTGLPALTANATGQVESWSRQAITDSTPTTWRETVADTSYDATATDPDFALPLFSYSSGDISLAGTGSSQETCTATTYAPVNSSLNLVGLVLETQKVDKPCTGALPGTVAAPITAPSIAQTNDLSVPSANPATDIIADTRTYYDDPTLATTWPQPTSTVTQPVPANADVSVVQSANSYTGGALTYQTTAATVYDAYGRPVTIYDGRGTKSTTNYMTTSYGTLTGTSATKAAVAGSGVAATVPETSTTALDPLRGLPLTVTDPNGVITTVQYDGLGRTTGVWKDSRPTSATANLAYTYLVSKSAPSVVTTRTLSDNSNQLTSTTIYDALDRVRQTQTPALSGINAGRLITDTFYDTHGWTVKTNTEYWDASAEPNATLMSVADNQVTDQTQTSYDGMGRPTVVTRLDDQQVKSTAYTQYTGDATTAVPPTGGVAQVALTDALGRTIALLQYTSAPTVTTTVAGGFTTASVTGGATDTTTYTFNAQGRPYQEIDPAGAKDTWSTSYNFLGQESTSMDPDSGITTYQYDPDGNVLQTTDAAGHTLSYTYDGLNRATGQYASPVSGQVPGSPATGQPAGNQVTAMVYDDSNNAVSGMTYPIGQATTQTSYTSTGAFTVQDAGYNIFGESLGENYTVPGTSALAGTYSYAHTYSTTLGLPASTTDPAAGPLASEKVTTTYLATLDLPTTSGVGLTGLVKSVAYTDLGQVASETVGSATKNATINNAYDPNTGALTSASLISPAISATTPVDLSQYAYDPSGNITSETDTRSGTQEETQCFGYDSLDRLTSAFTAAGNTCTTSPTSANVGSVVGDGISGSAYWTTWKYNQENGYQLGSQDQHALSVSGTDTTTSYTYGYTGTGGDTHTTALAGASTTGPTGTTTGTYTYNTLGATTSRPTGNGGGQESLTWNNEGKLSTATTTAGTSTYLYDTSGNVIELISPSTTTLYLPNQQIVLNNTANTTTSTRFYPLPGGGQAVRTGTGTNYGFDFTDQHNTATIQLNSSCIGPVWQQYTLYGAPRGTSTTGWLNPNGYLNKPQDTPDNLTLIGAREYDTTLGRFISLDPVLETTDPQELDGYSYAGGNPVTQADPTGMRPCNGSIAQCGNGSSFYGNGVGAGSGTTASSPAAGTNDSYVQLGSSVLVDSGYRYSVQLTAAYQSYESSFVSRNGIEPDEADEVAFWYTSCKTQLKGECGSAFTSEIGSLWQYEYGCFGCGQTPAGGGVTLAIGAGGSVVPVIGMVVFGTPYSDSYPYKATPGHGDAEAIKSLANQIEDSYPGEVVGTEVPIFRADGTQLTDADILLRNVIIQVKSGSATKIQGQLRNTLNGIQGDFPNMLVVGYAPDNPKQHILDYSAAQGTPVFTDPQELMDFLNANGAFGGVGGDGDGDGDGGGGAE